MQLDIEAFEKWGVKLPDLETFNLLKMSWWYFRGVNPIRQNKIAKLVLNIPKRYGENTISNIKAMKKK